MRPLYRWFDGADCFLVLFDPTRAHTWEEVPRWLAETQQHTPGAPVIVVATKLDLEKSHEVPFSTVQKWCAAHAADNVVDCIEVSAKTQQDLSDVLPRAILRATKRDDGRGDLVYLPGREE